MGQALVRCLGCGCFLIKCLASLFCVHVVARLCLSKSGIRGSD
jgi:hypothetical protein